MKYVEYSKHAYQRELRRYPYDRRELSQLDAQGNYINSITFQTSIFVILLTCTREREKKTGWNFRVGINLCFCFHSILNRNVSLDNEEMFSGHVGNSRNYELSSKD